MSGVLVVDFFTASRVFFRVPRYSSISKVNTLLTVDNMLCVTKCNVYVIVYDEIVKKG